MKGRKPKQPQGKIRQSQVVRSCGPGAMVDLRDHAVLVSGLDHWLGTMREIQENRLQANAQKVLGLPRVRLQAPPIDLAGGEGETTGVRCWQFPEWFVVQKNEGKDPVRTRRLVHLQTVPTLKYVDMDRKKIPVVPVRFVRACLNGHIGDIDWYGYAHEYKGRCRRQLWLDERGTSGDLTEVWVRCDCGASRSIATATKYGEAPLGSCNGSRPWLGERSFEKCGNDGPRQPNRLLVRTASDAYFPQVLNVISIPDPLARIGRAIDEVYADFLQYAESQADIKRERKKVRVSEALEGISDDVVWKEVQRRKAGAPESKVSLKQAEMEVFLSCEEEVGEDSPEGDFYARTLSLKGKSELLAAVDRVVLVHRLREVSAQVGFTRFEASMPDIEGELQLDVRRAPLADEISWLPASENRGEGVFLSFSPAAVSKWLRRAEVKARAKTLQEGFNAWLKQRSGSKGSFPGMEYVFLHSLSHLLITTVSLECGYAATSLKERVYAGPWGYGILLYTATPDAEGTLGGLVQVGRRIDQFLASAIEQGRLCSNDPVCAQHEPNDTRVERFLHGAACHGCLLISETCCERRNDFLDRALVVSTVEALGAEFFEEEAP